MAPGHPAIDLLRFRRAALTISPQVSTALGLFPVATVTVKASALIVYCERVLSLTGRRSIRDRGTTRGHWAIFCRCRKILQRKRPLPFGTLSRALSVPPTDWIALSDRS